MELKCKMCKGELKEWVDAIECAEHSEKPIFKTMWECVKCGIYYEVVWKVATVRMLSEIGDGVNGKRNRKMH